MVLRSCPHRKVITGFISFVNTLRNCRDQRESRWTCTWSPSRWNKGTVDVPERWLLKGIATSFKSMGHIQSEACSKSLSIPVSSILKCYFWMKAFSGLQFITGREDLFLSGTKKILLTNCPGLGLALTTDCFWRSFLYQPLLWRWLGCCVAWGWLEGKMSEVQTIPFYHPSNLLPVVKAVDHSACHWKCW